MGEGVVVPKGGRGNQSEGMGLGGEVDAMNLDKVNANPGRIGTQSPDEVIGQVKANGPLSPPSRRRIDE